MSFKIWTHTANTGSASTDGDVSIQIIGQQVSAEHLLDEDGDDFTRDATDDFTIADPIDVKDIREVRLFLEGGSEWSSDTWEFDRVVVECLESHRMWEWIGRSNPPLRLTSRGKKSEPAVLSMVEVTGNAKDALRLALQAGKMQTQLRNIQSRMEDCQKSCEELHLRMPSN